MSRGSNIGWNDTRANFSDANSAMSNANTSISQTGTVFDKLRQSILDEEQKAVDNAYRTKLFDENVKQFGMQHAIDQDKLSEDILSHRNNEKLTARGQDVVTRGQDLSYKADMASVGSQNVRNKLMLQQWEDTKRKEAIYAKAAQNEIENRNVLDAKISTNENLVGPVTPEMSAQLDRDKELRKALTSRQVAENIAIASAQGGHVEPLTSLLATDIAQTDARAIKSVELKSVRQKELEQSQLNSSKMIDSLNLVSGDKSKVTSAVTQLVSAYGISPEVATSAIISMYPTTGAWTSFSGQQKLDTPFFEIGDKLDNFDATDIKNPIVQAVLPYIRDKKNIPTEEEDVTSPPSSPLSRPVDLSTLTDSALKYREDQLTSSLPSPKDISTQDTDFQSIYKEMYRQAQGDRGTTSVPKEELEELQEKAEKLTAKERQKAIDVQVGKVTKEKERRKPNTTGRTGIYMNAR